MEGQIGNVGKYEVNDKGVASVEVSVGFPAEGSVAKATLKVELDIIEGLKEAAKHTSNSVDDVLVETVSKALGR